MNPHTVTDGDFVYGYGRTKHIRDGNISGTWSGEWGLCGTPGGYPRAEPERPLCKRCEKQAAKLGAGAGS